VSHFSGEGKSIWIHELTSEACGAHREFPTPSNACGGAWLSWSFHVVLDETLPRQDIPAEAMGVGTARFNREVDIGRCLTLKKLTFAKTKSDLHMEIA
jgi:hypothetical protein